MVMTTTLAGAIGPFGAGCAVSAVSGRLVALSLLAGE
jgi:hypothetical protein